jgi:hypothetical protein
MLSKIISGGQTGADRAALDFAIANNIPTAAGAQRGRLSEDGQIPSRDMMQEMPTAAYPPRTEKNILVSDGTVIISKKPRLSGGSLLTLKMAENHSKPVLHIHEATHEPGKVLAAFIRGNKIQVLNVAGPRGSSEPGAGDYVNTVMQEMWDELSSMATD